MRHALSTPELFPMTLDVVRDQVRLVRLDEERYRSASFLDERILPRTGSGEWIAWENLEAHVPARQDCDFIFHIGHVGSTLISRLLGVGGEFFCLREPAVLRQLAITVSNDSQKSPAAPGRQALERKMEVFLGLFARVWRPEQRSLVKATSFVSEIAPDFLTLQPSAKAILMFVPPVAYMATILAGPASREETRLNASMRLRRLHRRLGSPIWELSDMSEGDVVAMSWLSEAMALVEVSAKFAGRTRWLNFERFLVSPAEELRSLLMHLRGAARETDVATMMNSPDLTRYSKAPEFAYDSVLRRRVISQAYVEHREQINRGVAWLNAAGRSRPAVAEAVRSLAAADRRP